MLCSNCSVGIKPIVAVDIDGTLGDYHGHLLDFAETYLDAVVKDLDGWLYDGSIGFKTWFLHEFQCTEKDWHDVKLAYRQGGMKRTMPCLPEAQELCWEIKNAGAELWITTTRPYLSLDNIVPDTVEWCRRHGIVFDGILFDELKYQQFADRIDSDRVVAILDDLPEMCDAADNLFPARAIQVAGRYNAGARWWPLSANLSRARQVVIARTRTWREQHD